MTCHPRPNQDPAPIRPPHTSDIRERAHLAAPTPNRTGLHLVVDGAALVFGFAAVDGAGDALGEALGEAVFEGVGGRGLRLGLRRPLGPRHTRRGREGDVLVVGHGQSGRHAHRTQSHNRLR
ncbi:hypothetical protein, partial [Streptomyces erythrochromogenes]|uniref:hypothetical protein n=1 Tax=Streptomyces erythrochromogenes TaxID=285574 RepID=UPI0036FE735F